MRKAETPTVGREHGIWSEDATIMKDGSKGEEERKAETPVIGHEDGDLSEGPASQEVGLTIIIEVG
jgi:hypothetical protein